MFSSVQAVQCQPLLGLWSADHRINLMYQVLHRSQFLSEIRQYSFSTETFFSSEYINFVTVSSFDNMLFVHQHHRLCHYYTSVFTAKRPTTCLSCACRSLKSLNDSISVQSAATCSSPQGSSWTRMVVVPLPWLRQQLGIHCLMNCETRSPQCHLPTQLKDVSVSTIPGVLSALEVLCNYALYKSTFTYVSEQATNAGNWDLWQQF